LKATDPQKWRGYLLGVWQQRQKAHPEIRDLYDSKLILVQKLLEQWVKDHPGEQHPVTFDNWFTQPAFGRFLDQTLQLPYVGTLAESDKLHLTSGVTTLKDFADQLKNEHLGAAQDPTAPVFRKITIHYKGERETYYSYYNTHHLYHFGKPRLVINYRRADPSDNPTFFISNRLYWNSPGITRIRRHRWPVEVYHEEGKAEGLDQYQLRSFSAIQRHIVLVAVVYSMLRAAQHDPALQEKFHRQLEVQLAGNPAAWRRASQAQALWCLALFISAGLTQGQSLRQIMAPLIHRREVYLKSASITSNMPIW